MFRRKRADRFEEEIEARAKVRLKNMRQEEIAARAKKQKIFFMVFFGLIFVCALVVCILMLYLLTAQGESESGSNGSYATLLVIFAVCALCAAAAAVWFLRKPKEELALMDAKKELKGLYVKDDEARIARELLEDKLNKIGEQNFVIARSLRIKTLSRTSKNLYLDNENKKFIFQDGDNFTKVYNYSDMESYEVVDEDNPKRLKLLIRVNDIANPQVSLAYIGQPEWDGCRDLCMQKYSEMKENIHHICSVLEYMLNDKKYGDLVAKNTFERFG